LRHQARVLCGPFRNVREGQNHAGGVNGWREDQKTAYIPSLAQLLDQTGSIAFARREARNHVDAAITALDALPPSEPRDILTRMAQLILDREQ
jgi:geranylgeranyl pyrophosphate synthase